MDLSLMTEIDRNVSGAIVGRVKKGVRYKLSFKSEQEGTLRFWIRDEIDSTKSTVINRMVDITEGAYTYTFVPSTDGIITYHINGAKVTDLALVIA